MEDIINSVAGKVIIHTLNNSNVNRLEDITKTLKEVSSNDMNIFLERYGEHLTLYQLEYIEITYGEMVRDKYSFNYHLQENYKRVTSKFASTREVNKERNILYNKRYNYMINHLIASNSTNTIAMDGYFSIEQSVQRHPFIYYWLIGKYNNDDDDGTQDQVNQIVEPFKRDLSLSERLLENVQLSQQQLNRIETEFNEINYFTLKFKELVEQLNNHNNNNSINQLTSNIYCKWFQITKVKDIIVLLKEMVSRKNRLIQLKQTNLKRRDREEEIEQEEEDVEEFETDDEEEDNNNNNTNNIKKENNNEKMQQVEEEEEQDISELDHFIQVVKDMFIYGEDLEFDYNIIDKDLTSLEYDNDQENDYFEANTNGSNQNDNNRYFDLGKEEDYDYEAEYQNELNQLKKQ